MTTNSLSAEVERLGEDARILSGAVPSANSEGETRRDESKNDDWDLGTGPPRLAPSNSSDQPLRKPQQTYSTLATTTMSAVETLVSTITNSSVDFSREKSATATMPR